MATNSIGGINLAQIAQESLASLLAELPMLNSFTTDFSSDVSQRGASVTTRVAGTVAAVDASSGYTGGTVTSTAVTVSLSNHKAFTVGFTDLEVAKAGYSVLERTFIKPIGHSIAKDVVDAVLALVTTASFGAAAALTTAAANVTADSLADLATVLTGRNVPAAPRTFLCTPAVYGALAKDSSIQLAYAYGSPTVIRDNRILNVHGFNVMEYTGTLGAISNQSAIGCNPQALVLAARVPDLPSNWSGEAVNATDPASGLTLQVRRWYEGKDGQQYLSATVIYGVATGVTNGLAYFVTA